jgi:hypothetical protein
MLYCVMTCDTIGFYKTFWKHGCTQSVVESVEERCELYPGRILRR